MERGEVWLADLPPPAGQRPVVILTRSNVIPYLTKVVIAEITTQGKGYPTQIDIGQAANLPRPSWVSAESLHTIPKTRLVRYVGTLGPELLDPVSKAVVFALDLAPQPRP